MAGWPRSRKRLLLAAMLLPMALVTLASPLAGLLFVQRGGRRRRPAPRRLARRS